MSKYGVFSDPYFPAFGLSTKKYCVSVFSPNAGKYGPEKTPHLDTFHAVTGSSFTSELFGLCYNCQNIASILQFVPFIKLNRGGQWKGLFSNAFTYCSRRIDAITYIDNTQISFKKLTSRISLFLRLLQPHT